MPSAWDQPGDILPVEGEVRRAGGIGGSSLRTLEAENARLKKLLADAMLDNAVLKDIAAKKW